MESSDLTKEPLSNNKMRIVDIEVRDQNSALNVMINFLIIAQTKGVFTFEESAKIWECIQKFQK